MADTVQESNFFPPLRTSWPHIMRSFCFYSQVHGECIVFARSVLLVFQPRVEPVFSPTLSFFYGCRRQQTRFRRIWPRLVSLPRPDSDRPRSDRSWFRECAAKLAATRSDGDPRGRVSERERERERYEKGGRERESFNDRGPNRPCSLCYFHRRPENVLTYTLKREKYFVRSAIATKLEGCYFWNNFESKLFTRFYYVTCCGKRGSSIRKVSLILSRIYIRFARLGKLFVESHRFRLYVFFFWIKNWHIWHLLTFILKLEQLNRNILRLMIDA